MLVVLPDLGMVMSCVRNIGARASTLMKGGGVPKSKESDLQWQRARIRSKSRLTFGGLVTIKEQDSKVNVVYRCYTAEVGDSTLGTFSANEGTT